ncbi:MAG: di-trans,poly-cis-decaprenylcistransferase, partial [Betaproteobacteria bacterium]|nr:di-trans,poly-cis-decaprenylcistransferase [Betaproteobacteria bacterium]
MALFGSSTRAVPPTSALPAHVAIIMDGNGRWAQKRFLPRVAGHKAGLDAVRAVVRGCAERGIGHLTLFAFSSENWRRPADEVGFLTRLFLSTLDREVDRLHKNSVRFRAIGATEA